MKEKLNVQKVYRLKSTVNTTVIFAYIIFFSYIILEASIPFF